MKSKYLVYFLICFWLQSCNFKANNSEEINVPNGQLEEAASTLYGICVSYALEHRGDFPENLNQVMISEKIDPGLFYFDIVDGRNENAKWLYNTEAKSLSLTSNIDTVLFCSSKEIDGNVVVVFVDGRILIAPSPKKIVDTK